MAIRGRQVLCLDVIKKPVSDCILQYNNCGLVCENLKYTVSERIEKSPFSTIQQLSFDALSLTNPREYPYNPYIARNQGSLGYVFAADSMSLVSFKF